MKTCIAAVAAALVLALPALGAGPSISARAYLVENGANGDVLASRAPRARVAIASITKLMTVLVALEHYKLSDVVTVDAPSTAVGESTIDLRPGERITVRDLLKAALIQSANDAADALAAHMGTGHFVALMNEKARELGLTDTHFVRPDGLDAPGHVSSARDVTLLARAAMRIRFVRDTVRERADTISGGRTIHTWNDLLSTFPHVLGVKTGHTNAAGWSQVAAVRGTGVTIYATLLGGPSRERRNEDLAALLAWGLARYRVVPVIDGARVYALAATPYGKGALSLVAAKPLVHVVRVDRPLVERVVAATAVSLPVRRGERLGEVRVYAGRTLIGSRPLVASRSVARPDALGRTTWYAGRTLRHMWGWVTP